MRLIDADAVKESISELKRSPWYADNVNLSWKVGVHEAVDIVEKLCIDSEPTVDAEAVVRCKDCKWGVDYYHEGDCYCLHPKWGLTYFDGSWKFYCADGERREDETN